MFNAMPVMLGQYRPVDSFLHKLDARAKMLPITVVLILALLTDSFLFYSIILVALISALLWAGVTPGQLLTNFKPIILLILITSIYHLLFSGRDTEVLVDIKGIQITTGALRMATFFSLRLVLFVSVAFLVTLTSSPSDLADAFTRILSPLSRLRVPVQDLALILFMAIRFIPVLYEEFITIKNAQVIRGVRFSGSIFNRLKKTLSIIIPVFVAALQRADELAMAMEARGYDGDIKRTSYSRLHIGMREWLFMSVSTGLIIILFALTL